MWNRIKYFIRNFSFAVTHLDEMRAIRNNVRFKNIHKGERCFIFGNGPSIEKLDFGIFTNEYVFTVNQIMRKSEFHLLKTNYHFIADQNYFNIDLNREEDKELIGTIMQIGAGGNRPVCFFPSNQTRFVSDNNIDLNLEVAYFCSPISFTDYNILSTDFTHLVPRYGTVVHFCIAMAIYMGFSEIYLLGCEGTSIIANINSALKKNNVDEEYCYEINNLQKQWLEKVIAKKSIEKCAKSFCDLLVGYRYLSDYCKSHDIQLYNCTPESVVDSIKHKELNEVIGDD